MSYGSSNPDLTTALEYAEKMSVKISELKAENAALKAGLDTHRNALSDLLAVLDSSGMVFTLPKSVAAIHAARNLLDGVQGGCS